MPWTVSVRPVESVRWMGGMALPWIVSDELWQWSEPLLARRERGFRYLGRKPSLNRQVLYGILYVLHTDI